MVTGPENGFDKECRSAILDVSPRNPAGARATSRAQPACSAVAPPEADEAI
jgi:hypothetical protein